MGDCLICNMEAAEAELARLREALRKARPYARRRSRVTRTPEAEFLEEIDALAPGYSGGPDPEGLSANIAADTSRIGGER